VCRGLYSKKTWLPLARGERLGPNRDARGVGGEAEGLTLGFGRGRVDDDPEGGARVLRITAHRAVIEHEPFGREHLREANERQPEPVLGHQDVRDQAGCEQPATKELLGLRNRYDRRGPVLLRLLVLRARRHDAHRATAPVGHHAALLEADPFDRSFEGRVQDLHPLLGHRHGGEIAATLALRLVSLWRRVVRARRAGRGIRRGIQLELGGEPNDLLHLVGELDLQLRDVDPLGLRHEDAAAEQLELLLELLVRTPQLVALGGDPRKCLRRRGELRPERGDMRAHLSVRLRRRLELRHASTRSPDAVGFSS
jgi:hypothetical protein